MPLTDVLAALLSRPAGRVVDAPVRAIVGEALRDREVAGPAEVRALRELGEEVARLRTQVAELNARIAAMEARPAAPAPSAAQPPAAVPAPAPTHCRAPACSEPARHPGFCAAHRDLWIAGRLPGFVGPEGLFERDGRPFRVDPSLAGRPIEETAGVAVEPL